MKAKREYYKKLLLCLLALLGTFLLSGCEKKFWEYDNAWLSESPYIYLPIDKHYIDIEIDGEVRQLHCAWENDGTRIYLYIDEDSFEDKTVIKADCIIKSDELYLSFIEDNISDYEGKTIVLYQQSLEETDSVETE